MEDSSGSPALPNIPHRRRARRANAARR